MLHQLISDNSISKLQLLLFKNFFSEILLPNKQQKAVTTQKSVFPSKKV